MDGSSPHVRIRVTGRLDAPWASCFDGLDVHHDPDGSTVLSGTLVDQAALHGLLGRLRDTGATVAGLRVGTAAPPQPPHGAVAQRRSCQDPTVSRPLDGIVWPVRTLRLELRPAAPRDVAATWRYRRLDEVTRWITRAPLDRESYARDFVDPQRLAATIVVSAGAQVVGDLMLRVEDAWAQAEVAAAARGVQAELGWVLDPAVRGRGYATEAVEAVLRVCFEELGLRRVHARCFAANDASWRLMERVGMRRESHTVQESLHRSGQWYDGVGYGMLAGEWRGARGRAQPGGRP
ncbi:GNAT family N-acetyltransferase [Aquipuribacter nitratireducens]|uniref:GNAT family N-acetyltransferase n=1 Tax=Aquipuribacter nitratireducens TaxID=650104 RepID=A0ABW0GJM5_9MICO